MTEKKRSDYSSVSAAGEHGSRLDGLRALRRILARILDDDKTLARDIASVSRRYLEVIADIEDLEEVERAMSGDAGVSNENVVNAESKFRPEAI